MSLVPDNNKTDEKESLFTDTFHAALAAATTPPLNSEALKRVLRAVFESAITAPQQQQQPQSSGVAPTQPTETGGSGGGSFSRTASKATANINTPARSFSMLTQHSHDDDDHHSINSASGGGAVSVPPFTAFATSGNGAPPATPQQPGASSGGGGGGGVGAPFSFAPFASNTSPIAPEASPAAAGSGRGDAMEDADGVNHGIDDPEEDL